MLCKNAYWISYAYVKFERAHPESWRIGLWPITCVITQVLFLHCCRKVGSPPRWTDDVKNRSKFVDGGGSRPVVVNHDSLHIIYARPIFYSFAFPMKRINNFFPAQLVSSIYCNYLNKADEMGTKHLCCFTIDYLQINIDFLEVNDSRRRCWVFVVDITIVSWQWCRLRSDVNHLSMWGSSIRYEFMLSLIGLRIIFVWSSWEINNSWISVYFTFLKTRNLIFILTSFFCIYYFLIYLCSF